MFMDKLLESEERTTHIGKWLNIETSLSHYVTIEPLEHRLRSPGLLAIQNILIAIDLGVRYSKLALLNHHKTNKIA
ncbi:hypothetical protein NPIL_341891 [Nephila pilipes]|uniref:Uncharacterized protein n=1 Tax=Nephila pilipes TaxID=299642 RepID=A0A8X6UPR5_NEPPI|nr:hypothetical protein NPIL_341891 [Nephila pilipes]